MTIDQALIKLQKLSYEGHGNMELSIYSVTADVSEESCDCLVVDPAIPDSVPSSTGVWYTTRMSVCIM